MSKEDILKPDETADRKPKAEGEIPAVEPASPGAEESELSESDLENIAGGFNPAKNTRDPFTTS